MDVCSHTCDDESMSRPKTGETPIRRVRVSDPIWQAAMAKARAEQTTVSAVIVAYLTRYVSTPPRRRPPGEETGDET